jgi:hypothetical protein
MSQHPYVRNRHAAVALGLGGFAAGWFFLYDAWEGRGMETPKWFRWATWW